MSESVQEYSDEERLTSYRVRYSVPFELVAMVAWLVETWQNISIVEIFQPGKDEFKNLSDTARHVFVGGVRCGDEDNACDERSDEHGKAVPGGRHGSESVGQRSEFVGWRSEFVK